MSLTRRVVNNRPIERASPSHLVQLCCEDLGNLIECLDNADRAWRANRHQHPDLVRQLFNDPDAPLIEILPGMVRRLRAIRVEWSKVGPEQEVGDKVIALLDEAGFGCGQRQKVREYVERHFG